jgi:hypothetical protein
MAPAAIRQPRAAAPAPASNPDGTIASTALSTAALNLLTRQQVTTIPAYYGSLDSGPDPGTVAGITLGSVAGFVLLLWLLYTCINLGNPSSSTNETSTVVTEGTASVYTRRSNKHSRRASRRASSRRGREEVVEIRRSRGGGGGPVIVEETVSSVGGPSEVDRVIIEERRRSVSRPRMSMPRTPPPRRVESDEDEVVVIEEHSPPRRHRSRVRSVERRSSGYREVDPDRFAGGDASFVEVRRSGSHRR